MVMKQPQDELLRVYFYLNPEVDVKVTMGACLSEILRISTPEPPFKDGKMKIFFQLANKAYEFLPSMSGRAYTKALTILKRVTHHNAHRIMLDEGMYDLVREMFQLFLGGIRSDHSDKVRARMGYVMSQTILDCEDCDDLIVDLIMILLSGLKKENQDANPMAFTLAKFLFEKCENMIKSYIVDATKRSGIGVEHYDDIVASFCKTSTGYGYIVGDIKVELDESDGEIGEAVVQNHVSVPESTSQEGPSLGDRTGKPSTGEQGKNGDSSRPVGGRSYSENKNITIHPLEKLPTKTPPELRTKRLHDIPATAPSPLSTNVLLEGEAKFGRAYARQRWKKDVKSSGEDIEDVAVDTLQPREVGLPLYENNVTTSESTSRGKRIWKPNHRMKPEEGYQHIWMNKPRSRKEKEGNADPGFNSKESDSLSLLTPPSKQSYSENTNKTMVHFDNLPTKTPCELRSKGLRIIPNNTNEDITATTSSPLFKTVSSNAETQLGQLSDQQQGNKDAKDSGELSNSQSRSIHQWFNFGEFPNSLHQKRNATANYKETEALPSLSTIVSSNREVQLEKALVQGDQNNYLDAVGESTSKTKEITMKEEGSVDIFVFGKNLTGNIPFKAVGSTSRSSKPKAKPRKASNQQVKSEVVPPVQEVSENGGRPGPELIGKRIQVLWPEDKKFYKGSVTYYNPRNRKPSVDYDDGDSKNLDMLKECWLYL